MDPRKPPGLSLGPRKPPGLSLGPRKPPELSLGPHKPPELSLAPRPLQECNNENISRVRMATVYNGENVNSAEGNGASEVFVVDSRVVKIIYDVPAHDVLYEALIHSYCHSFLGTACPAIYYCLIGFPQRASGTLVMEPLKNGFDLHDSQNKTQTRKDT